MSFLTCFFVVHASIAVLPSILARRHSNGLEVAYAIANAAVFAGGAYDLIADAHGRPYPALMSLGVSIYFMAHVWFFLARRREDRPMLLSLMGLSGVFLVWTLPLALWIMLSYFAQIPTDLDKAALIDGASRLQILFRIIFPLAAPGALSTVLLVFIYSFNEFLFALMLTTDYNARTIPVGIALFEGLHGQLPWGHMMAIAVISIAPVILLTAVFQRRIIQGLVQGAVKG